MDKPADSAVGEAPIRRALVMKGGGVKGLALVGALIELEKHFRFDVYVGTSAGAIAAVLLASGLDAPELERRLREHDFVEFLDKSLLARIRNFLLYRGLHTGNVFEQWVQNTLKEKLPREQKVEMRDLPTRAIIYAASEDKGTVTFDSQGENANTPASFAVRCSMSIPYFFIPPEHHGQPIFDGGLLNNFPVSIFLEQHPGHDFIGMYLSSGEEKESSSSMLGTLINIITGRDEKVLVDRYKDRMIVIDPSPIRTTQFSLEPAEKDFLVYQGRAAALQFLEKVKPSPALSGEFVACTKKALHLREQAYAARRRRKQRRSLALASIAMMALVTGYLGFASRGPGPDPKKEGDAGVAVVTPRGAVVPRPTARPDPAKDRAAEPPVEAIQVTFTPDRFPYAAAAGNVEAVQDLLKRGASVGQTTTDGYTALHLAARAGHIDIVRLLVGRGANVNTQSKAQETALFLAARDGRTSVVAYLLEQKADPDMPAKIGSSLFATTFASPVAAAARQGGADVVRLLLANGASPNANPSKQVFMGELTYLRPLDAALGQGHYAIADMLLRHGARAEDGDLLRAVSASAPSSVIVALVKAGASPAATDAEGRSLLRIAQEFGKPELVSTLQNLGAK